MATINDLEPGDILVMQGPQGWSWNTLNIDGLLIKAIMYLTDSDVCHGAIYHGMNKDIPCLVDDGSDGVALHQMQFDSTKEEDLWYVRRLDPPQDMTPVLQRSDQYLKPTKTAYDWPLLFMVGMLLIFRRITPDSQFDEGLLDLLKAIVLEIDNYSKKKGVDEFICSQFVATCFSEAGSAYALQVHNGDLEGKSLLQSLIDQSAGLTLDGNLKSEAPYDEDQWNTLLKGIVSTPMTEQRDTRELTAADFTIVQVFLRQLVEQVLLPANKITQAEIQDPAELTRIMQQVQDQFVTPADLKLHCRNLSDEGTLSFHYVKAAETTT